MPRKGFARIIALLARHAQAHEQAATRLDRMGPLLFDAVALATGAYGVKFSRHELGAAVL